MFDARATLQRMFDEIINEGRLEVADELFADDYVDHGPMGDLAGRQDLDQQHPDALEYGRSVTDACVDLDLTTAMLDELAGAVRARRARPGAD